MIRTFAKLNAVVLLIGSGADLLTQAAMAHAQPITVKPWDLAIIEEK